MKRLLIEVDCGEIFCLPCTRIAFWNGSFCTIFGQHLSNDPTTTNGNPLRCPACLAAEKAGKP
jgi:hypothetical protein